jgi:hypothetical protein
MRKKGNLYEYIAMYVDDLAIAMKDPKELTDILVLEKKYKFNSTLEWISPGMKITPCASH